MSKISTVHAHFLLPGSMLPDRTRGTTQAQRPNCWFFWQEKPEIFTFNFTYKKEIPSHFHIHIYDKYHFVQLNAENGNMICKHKWWLHPNIWSAVPMVLTSPSMVEAMWRTPNCTLGKVKENPPASHSSPPPLFRSRKDLLGSLARKTFVRKRKATQWETSVNLHLLYLEMTPHPCPLGQNFFSRHDLRDVLHAPCTIYHHAAYN